jgi:hypothetical protein
MNINTGGSSEPAFSYSTVPMAQKKFLNLTAFISLSALMSTDELAGPIQPENEIFPALLSLSIHFFPVLYFYYSRYKYFQSRYLSEYGFELYLQVSATIWYLQI